MAYKMKKAHKETLRGIAAYILFAVERGDGVMAILANVGHDTGGLFAQLTGEPKAEFFSPRTRRYAERLTSPAELFAIVQETANGPSICTARDCGSCTVCKARAAIAKATGQEGK